MGEVGHVGESPWRFPDVTRLTHPSRTTILPERQGGNPMRGVVFLGNKQLEVREFPNPEPGPGQAVVKMRASGICGSDLHPYRGARAQTTAGGHEPCGEVAALGPGVEYPKVGARVMIHHYSGCG